MGKLIIFSAPSGAGKTTIVRHLLSLFPQLSFSISATTRLPRVGELDTKDYYFITKDDFLKRVSLGEFVEFEEVYEDVFYGTLKQEIERIWALGKCILFDIDVVGGINLKNLFGDGALSVFVKPPSVEVLKTRLGARNTDSEVQLLERLAKAERELEYAKFFDVVLLNDNLSQSLSEAEQIVKNFIADL